MLFRLCDPRFPFLWESADQPAARWHAEGAGPVHYFADTSHGAWAEFLRHENIRDPEDLKGIRRALWAVQVPQLPGDEPQGLTDNQLTGGVDTYPDCQAQAQSLRDQGVKAMRCPCAALLPNGATGEVVNNGLQSGTPRDGLVYVLFGKQPCLEGWKIIEQGHPDAELMQRVRYF